MKSRESVRGLVKQIASSPEVESLETIMANLEPAIKSKSIGKQTCEEDQGKVGQLRNLQQATVQFVIRHSSSTREFKSENVVILYVQHVILIDPRIVVSFVVMVTVNNFRLR